MLVHEVREKSRSNAVLNNILFVKIMRVTPSVRTGENTEFLMYIFFLCPQRFHSFSLFMKLLAVLLSTSLISNDLQEADAVTSAKEREVTVGMPDSIRNWKLIVIVES